jgi:hypothetical protein
MSEKDIAERLRELTRWELRFVRPALEAISDGYEHNMVPHDDLSPLASLMMWCRMSWAIAAGLVDYDGETWVRIAPAGRAALKETDHDR